MEYLFNVFGGTLSGFRFNGPPTQGSLALLRKAYGGQANLGWRTQSRWDWEALNTYGREQREKTRKAIFSELLTHYKKGSSQS